MGKRNKLDELIMTEIDVPDLIDTLDFTDENVVYAAKAQPRLYLDAVRFRIQLMRARTRAESFVQVMKAEKAIVIRQKAAAKGDRATEGFVSERLISDEELQQATRALEVAEEAEEFGKLLLEAFRMRRDALKVVADLIGAEVYVQRRDNDQPTELGKLKKKLKEKYPGKSKKGQNG